MNKPHLSLIIPAYNEEDRIGKTLTRVHEHLSSQKYDWEVLVVIDGASDDTYAVVQEHKRTFGDKLRIVNNVQNHGKGYVVRQGMVEAHGAYRIFMDADNSTDVSYVDQMLAMFDEGHDVVISSRDPKDAPGARQEIPQAWYKRQMGNMGNLFIQMVAVPGIWDTQNGFKGFTERAARDIFSRATIDRWAFDIEALAIARHLGYRIGIIPIVWKNDPKSHVKLSAYLQVLWETVLVRWRLITGKYSVDKKPSRVRAS